MAKPRTENEIAREVVDACYEIHTTLGPGLLQSVYERVLPHELRSRGLVIQNQVPIDIVYRDLNLAGAFAADIFVDNKVIVELKSVERVAPVHAKQLLTYLRLSDMRLGLLVNFGEAYIKNGIK